MADQDDPRAELAHIESSFAQLIASAEHARFAWTGASATNQYRISRRAADALERLKKLKATLLSGAPVQAAEPAIPAEVLADLKAAIDAVEWNEPEHSREVGVLLASSRTLLRALGRNV